VDCFLGCARLEIAFRNADNRGMSMLSQRRRFLQVAPLIPLSIAAGRWWGGGTSQAAVRPIQRVGGPSIKIALNAYSFSKLLNDHAKGRDAGMSLDQLVDFCARHGFDGLDPTGYFFPGYPKVPADEYVNNFKRRAFDVGIDILYQPFRHLGFGLGFRSLQIQASAANNDWEGAFRSNFTGPIAFVSTIGELNAIEPFLVRMLAEVPYRPLVLLTDRSVYRDAYLRRYPEAIVVEITGSEAPALL
jgi:hypothetical protein